jgi:hypothetical protein
MTEAAEMHARRDTRIRLKILNIVSKNKEHILRHSVGYSPQPVQSGRPTT